MKGGKIPEYVPNVSPEAVSVDEYKPGQRQEVAKLKIEIRLKQLNDLSYSKDSKWKKAHFS
jgi:hypothetical protein